jgi:hypothetical protein
MSVDTLIPRVHVMRMGRVLLIFAVLGGKSVGASFDCQWEPQCSEIPLTYFGSTHVEPTELPQAFAEFVPFVPNGSKVLDLRYGELRACHVRDIRRNSLRHCSALEGLYS